MSCFPAISLRSLLPKWADVFLPRCNEGETAITPERAADSTTLYARSETATYKNTNLETLPESNNSSVYHEVPTSTLITPDLRPSTNQRESLEIGYFNRREPSEGSSIWRIQPCKSHQEIAIGLLETLTTQTVAQMQEKALTVRLLDKIAKFKRYSGIARTPETVFIVVYVTYEDNSSGYVYGGPFICG